MQLPSGVDPKVLLEVVVEVLRILNFILPLVRKTKCGGQPPHRVKKRAKGVHPHREARPKPRKR